MKQNEASRAGKDTNLTIQALMLTITIVGVVTTIIFSIVNAKIANDSAESAKASLELARLAIRSQELSARASMDGVELQRKSVVIQQASMQPKLSYSIEPIVVFRDHVEVKVSVENIGSNIAIIDSCLLVIVEDERGRRGLNSLERSVLAPGKIISKDYCLARKMRDGDAVIDVIQEWKKSNSIQIDCSYKPNEMKSDVYRDARKFGFNFVDAVIPDAIDSANDKQQKSWSPVNSD